MPETDRWLADYGASHQGIRSASYWAAVIALVPATVGMLWSLPVPHEFVRISPLLNWGSSFLMAALVYYFIISMPLAIGMLPVMFGLAALELWLAGSSSIVGVSAGLFVLGIAGLCFGQRDRGGLPAVGRDIQLMMIAPLWILSRFYRRFGIPY